MSRVIAISADMECTAWDKVGGDLIVMAFVEILEDLTLGREAIFYAAPRSPKYWTKKAEEIHGISFWKAKGFPKAIDSCIGLLNWLKPLESHFPLPMVYHATGKLDFRWIEAHFRKEEIHTSLYKCFREDDELQISTLSLARKHYKNLPNHKLPTVAEHLGIELDHHEALSDARAAALIWIAVQKNEKTFTGELTLEN